MSKEVNHHTAPPETCASWVPPHIRKDTPTLEQYLKRIERQKQTESDSGMSLIEKAAIFGGSIVATTVAVGALAVATVDKTFHLGVGSRLEHIHPNPHEDGIKHDVQQMLHDFGHRVVQDEK